VEVVGFDYRLHLLLPEKEICVCEVLRYSVREKERLRCNLGFYKSTHDEQKELTKAPGSKKNNNALDTMLEIDNQEWDKVYHSHYSTIQ